MHFLPKVPTRDGPKKEAIITLRFARVFRSPWGDVSRVQPRSGCRLSGVGPQCVRLTITGDDCDQIQPKWKIEALFDPPS